MQSVQSHLLSENRKFRNTLFLLYTYNFYKIVFSPFKTPSHSMPPCTGRTPTWTFIFWAWTTHVTFIGPTPNAPMTRERPLCTMTIHQGELGKGSLFQAISPQIPCPRWSMSGAFLGKYLTCFIWGCGDSFLDFIGKGWKQLSWEGFKPKNQRNWIKIIEN